MKFSEMTNLFFDEKFHREQRKALKNAFSGKITGNFLLEVLNDIVAPLALTGKLQELFDWLPTPENMVTGGMEHFDYEICRYIVGAHRFNTIFVSDHERAKLESNPTYKTELEKTVAEHIRLRPFVGRYFRNKQLLQGDEFIFYSLPHDLFAIAINALANVESAKSYKDFFVSIFNKSLAVLALLEGNFTDNSFGICRSLIELYAKMMLVITCPEVLTRHDEFLRYDVDRNACGQSWPKEFIKKFDNRKWKKCNSKGDFLHFGFVDEIPGYFDVIGGEYAYSISGVLTYLAKTYGEDGVGYEHLKKHYAFCNGFAHGNTLRCEYPLNDYFNAMVILAPILIHTYKLFCVETGIDGKIDGFDIISESEKDYAKTVEQFNNRTTEKFREYYRRK